MNSSLREKIRLIIYRENNLEYSSRVLSTPTTVDESLSLSISGGDIGSVDMSSCCIDEVYNNNVFILSLFSFYVKE
jgi:hypothetical protein